jgi:ABC-type sugar transport system permease subunit
MNAALGSARDEKLLSGRPLGFERGEGIPYLFVIPALLYLFFFWGYPAGYAFYLSLTDTSFGTAASHFTGLENYRRLLQDPLFWVSLKNSGVLLVASVLLEVFLGVAAALYLSGARRPYKGALIVALLLPWLFSEIVTAMTWRSVFHEPFGLLNGLLRQAGISPVPWLSRPKTAMAALVVASLWQGVGISAMVVLAALQNVPARLMDLASIDGAVGWRRFVHVVLPQLKGVLLLNCMLVGIKSLGSFTLVFTLTGGGPGYGTEVLATYVYRLTFSHYELGYASAVGVCLAVLFLSLVSIVFLLQRGGPAPGYRGRP